MKAYSLWKKRKRTVYVHKIPYPTQQISFAARKKKMYRMGKSDLLNSRSTAQTPSGRRSFKEKIESA